jgi:hypothetical protein
MRRTVLPIVLGLAAVILGLGYGFCDPLAPTSSASRERSYWLQCTTHCIHLGRALDLIEVGAIECTMPRALRYYANTHGVTATRCTRSNRATSTSAK